MPLLSFINFVAIVQKTQASRLYILRLFNHYLLIIHPLFSNRLTIVLLLFNHCLTIVVQLLIENVLFDPLNHSVF